MLESLKIRASAAKVVGSLETNRKVLWRFHARSRKRISRSVQKYPRILPDRIPNSEKVLLQLRGLRELYVARKFPKLFRATSLSTSWKLRRQCASVVYTPLRLRLHVGMLALGPNPAALADLDNPKTGSPCLLEAPKCSFTGSQKEFEMPSVRPTSLEQDQGPRKIKFPREALP